MPLLQLIFNEFHCYVPLNRYPLIHWNELEIDQNNENNSVSVNLDMIGDDQSIEVTKTDDGLFKVTLPDGSSEFYKFQNGSILIAQLRYHYST